MRSASFIGIAAVTFMFAKGNSTIALVSLHFLILLFSISRGFASITYSDIVGKHLSSEKRGGLYAEKQFFSGIAALLGVFFIAWFFGDSKVIGFS